MSFPALFLACQAVSVLEPMEDDEFGLSWSDLDVGPELDVRWALYRSEGSGVVFGVLSVDQQTISGFIDSAVVR